MVNIKNTRGCGWELALAHAILLALDPEGSLRPSEGTRNDAPEKCATINENTPEKKERKAETIEAIRPFLFVVEAVVHGLFGRASREVAGLEIVKALHHGETRALELPNREQHDECYDQPSYDAHFAPFLGATSCRLN
jgi:hypothetical protein